jgi:serine/threonine-protein kinase
MAIQIVCPRCGLALSVPESLLGKKAECSRCHCHLVGGQTNSGALSFPGTVLGERYEVRNELGQGTFGVIYHAQDRMLNNREVAIKMLRAEVAESADARQRLEREARAMVAIVHPSILPVLDYGLCQGRYYIVFPLVKGRTLKEEIPASGLADCRRAANLVIQIARALHYLWSRHRILHRDVKPANILLAEGDKDALFLMDFGLAACQDQAGRTLDKGLLGTPAYMAPEQAAGKLGHVGHSADVYSAGVVLFELLTGTVPFTAPYPAVLDDIRARQAPPPSTLRPSLDPALDAIVARALAKSPRDRYSTGQELAEALENLR